MDGLDQRFPSAAKTPRRLDPSPHLPITLSDFAAGAPKSDRLLGYFSEQSAK